MVRPTWARLLALLLLRAQHLICNTVGAEELTTFSDEGDSGTSIFTSQFPHSIAARKGDGRSSSEQPSETTLEALPTQSSQSPAQNTELALDKALRWLDHQRHPDWGWGNDTHRVIMTLQLANQSNELDNNQVASLEMQLSTKQLEIEILLMLSKHHESAPLPLAPSPAPLSRLSLYVCALSALCRDPRAFHSRDLVAVLLHHEPQHDFDFAFGALAACGAGAHVRKRHIRRLLDIANAAADHNVDTIAMVILALRCIVQDHRHRNLLHFVRRPMAGLARQQQPDGSFGGIPTTALALQALYESSSSLTGGGGQQHYNRSAGIAWLLGRQSPAGDWANDTSATTSAALALSQRGLAALRAMPCKDNGAEARHDTQEYYGGDGSVKSAFPSGVSNESDARNVSFTYTLWVGSDVTENYTLYMIAPRNISFYHVMQLAADQDPKYEFSSSEWPNGHYVHTLASYKEEPMGYHYWLLYRLPEQPDPASPPGNQLVAPVGVDDLLVEEGEHYLFWYKKL